ncbi:MAG: TSUP family transporter [candidate division Zixibacteria bacterium]|nr:TSUP family transporter [Gammaproteobacteria bacterium]NIX59538.1 TSUP family transporter [candidate division Zixibacteria bacterium]
MEFPIAGVFIDPIALVLIGFLVGILGGFFGVGGGFLAAPFMFWIGVPMNFVVGTDLAHMTGKSIVAFKRHRALGHVDVKLGIVMIAGTMVGVEIGAQAIEALEAREAVDQVIGVLYIFILLLVTIFTAYEAIRSLRMLQSEKMDVKDVVGFQGIARKVYNIRIPPMVSFPASGIESISLWSIVAVGLLTGVLAGMLGVGGGFIRMPMLVYFLGIPTHVAVGTDLFEIIFSAGYGTLTHALKGNVDIIMALVMQTGAAIGAQIGAVSTQYFTGPRIRLFFSFLPLVGALMVILRLLGIVAI